MENVLIRSTTADDLKFIMEMIKVRVNNFLLKKVCFKLKPLIILIIQEIAEFVNMLDSLKITENDLRRDGNFDGSDHASFYSYVAEIDSCIVGYSFSHFTYSSDTRKGLFLEEIYVKESFRKQGIGKKLFLENVKFAKAESCHRFEFHVLKWNHNAKKFYKKLNAENVTERDGWELFRLDHLQKA